LFVDIGGHVSPAALHEAVFVVGLAKKRTMFATSTISVRETILGSIASG